MTAIHPFAVIGLGHCLWNDAVMTRTISDLADYSVAAWAMDKTHWRFVFDSSDGKSVVQHELTGVLRWRTTELRDGIGVMAVRLTTRSDGSIAYTIDTVCNETIEILCSDVIESDIKRRA